ncbi:16S rRNA (cytosine(967)-C(5))-methyltransferase RsmB, partial [Staphylococcus nepalensis]
KVVNGILRNMMRSDLPNPADIENDQQRIAIMYSLPKWIVKHWVTHFGLETTEAIAQSLLERPGQTVRVNTHRTTIEDAIARLEKEDYEVSQDHDIHYCLHVSGRPVVESRAFKDGYVSIQDKSSMFVAEILAPVEGENILDACSA